MPRPIGVPDDALCIFYAADNGKSGDYYFWIQEVGKGELRRKHYYWHALGNNGEEASGFESTQAAKKWIRDGSASVKR